MKGKNRKIENKKLLNKKRPVNEARYEEARLHRWILENELLILKEFKIDILDSEISLPKALDTLKRETYFQVYNKELDIKKSFQIGRIDLLFRYHQQNYCCEIKCPPFKTSDFWDALKVIGYTVYYNWWKGSDFKPSILIPKNSCKLECFIVASRIGLTIFSFEKDKFGGYFIEEAQAPLR